MNPTTVLLANGYFLSLVLFILLITLASKNGLNKNNNKIREDIKKIKKQINESTD